MKHFTKLLTYESTNRGLVLTTTDDVKIPENKAMEYMGQLLDAELSKQEEPEGLKARSELIVLNEVVLAVEGVIVDEDSYELICSYTLV